MELELEIWAKNDIINGEYTYDVTTLKLDYYGFSYTSLRNRIDSYEFSKWEDVSVISCDGSDFYADDTHYFLIVISPLIDAKPYSDGGFRVGIEEDKNMDDWIVISEQELAKLNGFLSERNLLLNSERTLVHDYANSYLSMAENLMNIIDEDVFLDIEVLMGLQANFSLKESRLFGRSEKFKDKLWREYHVVGQLIYGPYTKQRKKEWENTRRRICELSEVVCNFVEIVMDEKGVMKNTAEAIVYEAVQEKAIEHYANIWSSEYDIKLEKGFNEYGQVCENEHDLEELKPVFAEYIRDVIRSEMVDIDKEKGVLLYFLLSKAGIANEIVLCDCFAEFYEGLDRIKKELHYDSIKLKLKSNKRTGSSKYSINDVDLMNGTEFENFVSMLFEKMGYSTIVTKGSGDQGLDVIASKEDTKIGIQAKRYSGSVGNSAVQEAVAGKNFYGCDKVVVITSNYFTSAAKRLAQSNDVLLWDRDMLKEKIKDLL